MIHHSAQSARIDPANIFLEILLFVFHSPNQILKRLIFRTIAMQTEPAPNLKLKVKNLISAPVFITIITITIWFILSTAETIFAPLSAPPNISKKLSAISDDLASSVSTCPDISSACSAPHNIAIEDKFYSSRIVSTSDMYRKDKSVSTRRHIWLLTLLP